MTGLLTGHLLTPTLLRKLCPGTGAYVCRVWTLGEHRVVQCPGSGLLRPLLLPLAQAVLSHPQVESPKFPKSPGRRKPTPNMTPSLTFHSPHVLIALIKCLLCAEHSTMFNRGR